MTDLSEKDIDRIAERVAEKSAACVTETMVKKTVHECLSSFGVDVTDPHAMQQRMLYLDKLYTGSAETRRAVKKGAIGVFVAAGLYMAYEAVEAWFRMKYGG